MSPVTPVRNTGSVSGGEESNDDAGLPSTRVGSEVESPLNGEASIPIGDR